MKINDSARSQARKQESRFNKMYHKFCEYIARYVCVHRYICILYISIYQADVSVCNVGLGNRGFTV